jgi:hypothetical protein
LCGTVPSTSWDQQSSLGISSSKLGGLRRWLWESQHVHHCHLSSLCSGRQNCLCSSTPEVESFPGPTAVGVSILPQGLCTAPLAWTAFPPQSSSSQLLIHSISIQMRLLSDRLLRLTLQPKSGPLHPLSLPMFWPQDIGQIYTFIGSPGDCVSLWLSVLEGQALGSVWVSALTWTWSAGAQCVLIEGIKIQRKTFVFNYTFRISKRSMFVQKIFLKSKFNQPYCWR